MVLLTLTVCVGAVVSGAWLAFGSPSSWKSWLGGMDFESTGSGRVSGMRDATGESLQYLGRGKARLGEFTVRMFNPASRTALRADFRLEGRTDCPDEEAFNEFIGTVNRAFREQVTITVRNCSSDDLADPRYRILEKKLVSRVNRALDRPFLKSAQIKEFCLYESVDKGAFIERDPANLTGGR